MGTVGKSYSINRYLQRGLGFTGIMFWLMIFAFAAAFTMSAAPMFTNHLKVVSIAKDVVALPAATEMSPKQIRTTLNERFNTNNLWDLDPAEVIKISKEKGQPPVLLLDYEASRPLFYNLNLVAHFNEEISSH